MKPLQVLVFNVGQGDNLLLCMPDGTYGFIDFFYNGKINGQTAPPSLTYVQHNHLDEQPPQVALFHLSHYHLDHLKGADQWIQWAEDKALRHLWLPFGDQPQTIQKRLTAVLTDKRVIANLNPALVASFNKKNKTYETQGSIYKELEKFYNKHEGKIAPLFNRQLPPICATPLLVKACCLAPDLMQAIKFMTLGNDIILLSLLSSQEKKPDANDISAILQLVVGQFRLLFGGDAVLDSIVQAENYIRNQLASESDFQFPAHFVKVFHHGSKYSSSEDIWSAILPSDSPAYLAISAGAHQKLDHPDLDTLEHIEVAANKKNTQPRIFATNAATLGSPRNRFLEHPEDYLEVNWPQLPKEKRQKQQEKEAKVDSHLQMSDGVDVSNNETAQFLGYCFEFDVVAETIKVKQIVRKNADAE